jgi:hypothetical protein
MLASEKIALAAHLHVLLRRKTGRVTDTEWMVENADYARAVIRFARQKAQEGNHTDLAEYAAKLEAAVLGIQQPRPAVVAGESTDPGIPRYIGGIR